MAANTVVRILYLEDEPKDAELVQASLEAEGIVCDLTRADTQADFLKYLREGRFDLILADYTLPLFDGISALRIAQEISSDVPFIFVSGTLGEEMAIEALKIGATDYVFKTRLSRLVPSVRRALRETEERTDRIRAQEALRRSEAYLAEAQKISQTGTLGWDFAAGKIYWSEQTFRIFEYEPSTEPTLELILLRTHPEDRVPLRQAVDRVRRERKDFDFEHRLQMPNGSVKYLRVVGRPSNGESGCFEFVGAVTDITERKLAEEALQKAQTELAHVRRVTALGELTASIAHQINQPLAAVVTNANASLRWLAGDSPNLAETREAIRRIIRDSHRAGDVISRMRALFRKAPETKERLDINEVIEEVLVLTLGEAQRNRVALRTELANDLPTTLGDRILLQQVILNLLINAIEVVSGVDDGPRDLSISSLKVTEMPSESEENTLEDEASVEAESTHILIAVRDSGPGLDPEHLDRLFDAFYTTTPHGLGMGLAISRSIIEAHGGRLWATPNLPRGAAFQFTLPIREG